VQAGLDPHVYLQVQAIAQSYFGHVHPVCSQELSDGRLVGSVHREVGREVERIDHELDVDLGQNRHSGIRGEERAGAIDLVVAEGQCLERTLWFFFVQFDFEEVGGQAAVETHHIAPVVQRRVGRYAFVIERLDQCLYVRKALHVFEGLLEVFAVLDVSVDALFERLVGNFFVGEVDSGSVGRQYFADVPEASVAHQRAVALLVTAERPLPRILWHGVWSFVSVGEYVTDLHRFSIFVHELVVFEHISLVEAHFVVQLIDAHSGAERLLAWNYSSFFFVDLFVSLFVGDEASHESALVFVVDCGLLELKAVFGGEVHDSVRGLEPEVVVVLLLQVDDAGALVDVIGVDVLHAEGGSVDHRFL